ncbi:MULTISPECIES: tRNA lysidine(34) synthetase TilS [Anaeromyxobacter]|uniref:tRNA lysidine(34) synthetase TilS n=1 Tax=Anaeromyxobacter TaxID=161492 RepID=UPI001F570278|nr:MULTISPECIES: tRNA lysidine(34) synthetase TilS [unclassified Anaeromyxobacter]
MRTRIHPYPAAVLATIRRRRLLSPGDRVLVALSGGPDSTALLAALAELRDTGCLPSTGLAALNVDHGLRPGGAEDAAAASAICERLGIPFEAVRVTVAPGNVQSEARRARYAALRAAATRAGATRIATGHTRTDQAETVLLRLMRGAGARGLSGIPPRRGPIVRPLIDRSREEGLEYLAARGIPWRVDPTNATPRFARNRLRLELWPALTALAPAAERAIARAADLAREDERALSRLARALAGDGASVALETLRGATPAVRRRVVRRLWARATGQRGSLEARHVEAILSLVRRERPGKVTLPGGRLARCRYGRLELLPSERAPEAGTLAPIEVRGPGRYALPEHRCAVEIECLREGAVPWPLALRTRRPGDRWRPDGGRGSKTLKRWLIDRKVPRERRDGLVLLARGAEVVAIPELAAVGSGFGPTGAGLAVHLVSDP